MLLRATMSKTDVVTAILEPEIQRRETKRIWSMLWNEQSNDHTPIPFCVGSVKLVQFHGESLIPYSVCLPDHSHIHKESISYGSLGGAPGETGNPPGVYTTFVETGLDRKKTSTWRYWVLITYSSYWINVRGIHRRRSFISVFVDCLPGAGPAAAWTLGWSVQPGAQSWSHVAVPAFAQ